MNEFSVRTLAGDPGGAQHLSEHLLTGTATALAPLSPGSVGENFIFLLCLPGPAAQLRALDRQWRLEPDQLLWLRHSIPVHAAGCGARPARLLAWRFTAQALAAELAEWLLALPATAPSLTGPRPLTPAETALALGLRSCPVAPALRMFWASAKLAELLTHLLPPPVSPAEDARPDPVAENEIPVPPAVQAALNHMQTRLAEPLGLVELASVAGQSPAHFSRLFSATFGHGPTAHLRRLRMDHAARLLASGAANVTEAALSVGYQSLGQFSRVFSEHHGRPPSAFLPRKNG